MIKKLTGKMPKGYLAATAHLVQDGNLDLWKVGSCPICGDHHLHGAGHLSEDPRSYLSHRVEHCLVTPTAEQEAAAKVLGCSLTGYILTDENPRLTEKLLMARRATLVGKANHAAPVRKQWGPKRIRELIATARSKALKVAA